MVMVWETDRNSSTTREPASVPDYLDYRSRGTSVESLSALMAAQVNLAAPDGDPVRVAALRVSRELLPMLGIGPLAGRGFIGRGGCGRRRRYRHHQRVAGAANRRQPRRRRWTRAAPGRTAAHHRRRGRRRQRLRHTAAVVGGGLLAQLRRSRRGDACGRLDPAARRPEDAAARDASDLHAWPPRAGADDGLSTAGAGDPGGGPGERLPGEPWPRRQCRAARRCRARAACGRRCTCSSARWRSSC